MQKITICGSVSFEKEMHEQKQKLENQGYQVLRCPKTADFESYEQIHKNHYSCIFQSDILFVFNKEKNGISDYIGPGTFAEIAFAVGLNLAEDKSIKILCLNPLPKNLSYSSELELWQKLGWIKQWPNN